MHLASNKETAELLIDSGANEMPRHSARERLPWFRPQRATKSELDEAPDRQDEAQIGSMIEDNEPHRAKAGETALHAVAGAFRKSMPLKLANCSLPTEPK